MLALFFGAEFVGLGGMSRRRTKGATTWPGIAVEQAMRCPPVHWRRRYCCVPPLAAAVAADPSPAAPVKPGGDVSAGIHRYTRYPMFTRLQSVVQAVEAVFIWDADGLPPRDWLLLGILRSRSLR